MSNPATVVQSQITDALTQASNHVLGVGPVVALINTYMAQAQAQAVLVANMVSQQQQNAMTSQAVTVRNVSKLLGGRRTAASGGATAMRVAAPVAPPASASHEAPAQGPDNMAVW